MSTDTERVEESSETSFLETWEDWYHIPIIGAVVLFMLLSRLRSYGRFVTEDGTPQLAAIDSWYHWRTVQWTAENYPNTMPYEIWTSFPTGRYVGQFGTLFDQIIVTVAMIVGLGDPSTETLYAVSLIAVPVMAALVAIPVFFIGRRLGGTFGGIISILLLALVPGTFFYRTTTGQLQHHVAEVLFMATAVLAMMVALRAAERDKPIYELVVDSDWDTLRKPTLYSVLAGIALSLYIWTWPPGVVLIGIFAVFFTVQLCLDYVRGVSPDHVAFVGVISLGVTALVTTLLIEEPGTSVTSFGYLQPATAALVAAGCLFMAWFARQWNSFGVDRRYYPVAIGGMIVVSFVAMALVVPDLYRTLVGNLTSRLLPLDPGMGAATIAEARPPGNFPQHVFDEFGMAFYTMLVGLAFLVARPFLGREYRTEYTLVIVWSLFLISMAATQVRFAYYLVLAVAVVNAVFVADLVRLFNLEGSVTRLREVETYQIIVLLMVVLLLFAPLLPPVANVTAWERGDHAYPSDDAMAWEEANHWLQGNSPEPGDWAGAGYDDELEYYGTYDYPEDGDYDYPEGSYGVMSWWDYGHLITVQGERIPHTNPFQSNARSASSFLVAQSEDRGELIMDAIAEGESGDQTDEELEAIVGDGIDSHEEMRYVMIDHKMVGGKFGAITQWSDPDGTYAGTGQYAIGNDDIELQAPNQNYEESMVASLYLEDANDLEHYRLVHETDDYAAVGGFGTMTQRGIQSAPFESVRLEQLGMEGSWSNETQQYQMQVDQSRMLDQIVPVSQTQFFYDVHVTSSVKTFERVEGATITGSVDESVDDATVYAQVDLETDPGRTFTYTQEVELADDGSFELTVPYATNDELGTEDGYTNSSVVAVDDYTVAIGTEGDDDELEIHYSGETDVPETAVIDGETVDVTLEEFEDDEDEPIEDPDEEPDGDEMAEETEFDDEDVDIEDADANETDE
ncbi:oligosaccharyl transferase, archaeosortase A system-associated [Halobacteria archaeon AArc-m2/3/4]|uniref:dolichyl-phosphooligosaccharide-protein glycotransferase n=1 Tax=Natronoglomus mannanivorans TaxID=2979990 RepID=A0ABT2QDL5_9EURY|nr:oligosaccharyl transferase, archaeosortase A system-associated [Halobacteria archaeon AArc-m2/3/4]